MKYRVTDMKWQEIFKCNHCQEIITGSDDSLSTRINFISHVCPECGERGFGAHVGRWVPDRWPLWKMLLHICSLGNAYLPPGHWEEKSNPLGENK